MEAKEISVPSGASMVFPLIGGGCCMGLSVSSDAGVVVVAFLCSLKTKTRSMVASVVAVKSLNWMEWLSGRRDRRRLASSCFVPGSDGPAGESGGGVA